MDGRDQLLEFVRRNDMQSLSNAMCIDNELLIIDPDGKAWIRPPLFMYFAMKRDPVLMARACTWLVDWIRDDEGSDRSEEWWDVVSRRRDGKV